MKQMTEMFYAENNLNVMNEADIATELEQIVEAQFYDEDMSGFDEEEICKTLKEYKEIEAYYKNHKLFGGYLNTADTVNTTIYLIACDLQDTLFKTLCDDLKSMKIQSFENVSRLPTDMNSLICGYL